MRQLDYDYPCDSTPAMGFHLVVVDDYSRGLGSGALRPVEELLVELGAALSRIITASILHFKEHTTYCLRLSTATGT